jgi:hypothetical protein
MEKSRNESNEGEYFESLIFVSYIIMQSLNNENKYEAKELVNVMAQNLFFYAARNLELVNKIQPDLIKFIINRISTTENEIVKKVRDKNYLTPYIINNLYLNPLNETTSNNDDIDHILGFDLLMKNMAFSIKYKHLSDAVNDTLEMVKLLP